MLDSTHSGMPDGGPDRLGRSRRGVALLLVLALALVVGTVVLRWSRDSSAGTAGPSPSYDMYVPVIYPGADAPALELTDQLGRPFSLAQLRGNVVLVNFGYTHCPDVCPTTLAIDRQVMDTVGTGAAVVFVTIDPERDTPDQLRIYLDAFHRSFIGLTGSADQIRDVARAWNVVYVKGQVEASGAYPMIHTAGTYMVDPAGRLRLFYGYGTPAAVLSSAVRDLASGSTLNQ
jgi:protein SCO1/2